MRWAHQKWMGFILSTCFAMTMPMTAAARSQTSEWDVQSWNEMDIQARISPILDITLSSQVRLSAEQTNPATYSNGVDLNIKASDHLILTPSYYLIASRSTAGAWSHSRVPILAATPWYAWGRWMLSDRNRFAQVKGAGSDFWLYQNRVRLDYAIGREGRASLFVWDEVSYYSVFHTWNRNRVAAGARVVGNKAFAIDVYYVHQNDTRTSQRRIDGIGIIMELRTR